ncbi:hypothetical protein EON83_17200 [bacterium]|nr:MAG: hypothetical protein EON83_17200 [bacterium]
MGRRRLALVPPSPAPYIKPLTTEEERFLRASIYTEGSFPMGVQPLLVQRCLATLDREREFRKTRKH